MGVGGGGRIRNIVVIVVDTLRKDYAGPIERALSSYGFVSYDRVVAPAPWTVPSHASMFTGLYPSLHGSHETRDRKIPYVPYRGRNALARSLRERGFKPCLLTANPLVHPRLGLEGFDCVFEYEMYPRRPLSAREIDIIRGVKREIGSPSSGLRLLLALAGRGHATIAFKLPLDKLYRILWLWRARRRGWPREKGCSVLLPRLARILESGEPHFVFVNLMEVHEPYSSLDNEAVGAKALSTGNPPPELVRLWRERYPEHVRYVADKLAEALEHLERRGVLSSSLVIVTSDHGQLLGERGRIDHGVFLDDELLLVPFLVRYPDWMEPASASAPEGRWLSLTRLRDVVDLILQGEPGWPRRLYEETVYAESYGLIWDFSPYLTPEELAALKERYERHRIAVYHRYYKGVFDVASWSLEEAVSYRGPLGEGEREALRREAVRFLLYTARLRRPRLLKRIKGG